MKQLSTGQGYFVGLVVFATLPLLTCGETEFAVNHHRPASVEATKPPPAPAMVAAPRNWPKCWLSARLATAESMRLNGMDSDADFSDPLYKGKKEAYGYSKQKNYRHEFRGSMKNPSEGGKCILNWFASGHTHTKEPWMSAHAKTNNLLNRPMPYIGVVSCTADKTPQCTCISAFSDQSDENARMVSSNLCVQGSRLVNSNNFSGGKATQLQNKELNECRSINKSAMHLQFKHGQEDYTRTQEITRTVSQFGLDVVCGLDLEPFSPQAQEKDWYAHKITHWGALTCHKRGVDTTKRHCRCHSFIEKSYFTENARSSVYQSHTCLQCDGTSCKVVSNLVPR